MIIVKPVTDWSQFTSCLQLRLETYAHLGYLSSESRCDIDPFDWSSVHFIAVDEDEATAGTVRLIIEAAGGPEGIAELQASEQWCSRLQKQTGTFATRSASIPILATMKDNQIADAILHAERPAELSRIIVAPKFRGVSVCRELSNAVVEKARELHRDVLFLQCLPKHVGLFQKLGFEPLLQALDYRLLNVPDRVVAMRMLLDGSVTLPKKSKCSVQNPES